MLNGALLGILEDAATVVLTMTEGLQAEEFFASPVTQREVLRQLRIMTDTIGNLPAETRAQLAEIDWDSWTALGVQLKADLHEREAVWLGVHALVPAMLLWLRVYRRSQPEIFSFVL